jgi:mono/diheme cytochrome c family protein
MNPIAKFGIPAAIAGIGILAFASYGQQSGASPASAAAASNQVDYNFQVRPILSDNCFRCHGPDAKSRQAGLRLDDAASAYAQAIVPGKPEESEIIKRITSADPSYRMPPASLHKQLSAGDIATLRAWIEQGAEYKPHWSFIAPIKPAPHQVSGRVANPIDQFVLARLAKEGLKPSPDADKPTLINRVTLTLTGLPPTLDEVDAFLKDSSANAYEKVVDRLLATPAYGENMAAYWMNIARYSESDGFLDDHHDRMFWPYRDWVIAAFNRNMPYDQFSTWQLAGDLLPNATKEQKLATAFLRVGKRTSENGAIDEEYRVEYALDRANVVGQGFLALTTGCARCHDHKYDPIAQKDYYALSGFFNNVDEPGFFAPGFSTIQGGPTLRWADAETEAKIASAEAALKKAEDADRAVRDAARKDAAAKVVAEMKQPASEVVASIQKSVEAATVAYYPFETTEPIPDDKLPQSRARQGQPPANLISPFRGRGGGPPPAAAAAQAAQAQAGRGGRGGIRVPNGMIREKLVWSPSGLPGGEPAVLEDASIRPGGAKGNAFFITDENRGLLGPSVGFYDRTQPFSINLWFKPGAEYENSPILIHRDDDNSGGAGYKLNLEKNHLSFYMMHSWPFNELHVVSKQTIPAGAWTHIAMTYDGSSRGAGVTLYVNGKPVDVEYEHDQLTESSLPRGFSPAFNEFVGVEFGRRFREVTPKESALDEIRFFNRQLTPIEVAYLHDGDAVASMGAANLSRELTELAVATDPRVVESGKSLYQFREAENQAVSWVPEVMVTADAPHPRQTYVLSRGLYNQHLDPVEPSALTQIFPFDPKLPRNRMGLARWLFDPKNPLTARVFVNRLWQMQFGTGLVDTSEDFGMQGSLPTHPDLLDWLAVDFIQSGWDIKRLNKMIVMSATFGQSSDETPALVERDPQNRLLARGPRYRMSAEQVRDSALAISGLLVKTIGGPSAYPYQPDGIWVAGVTQYRYPKPEELSKDDQHRRSLYTFVKRNTPPPSMSVFDFSERHTTIARRLTSNTPLQALVLMSDPQYLEAYRVLAANVLKQSAEKDDQIRLVFCLATRRLPTDAELAALRQYYNSESVKFAGDRKKAEELINVGVTPVDATVDAGKLAALANVTAAVMNTPDAYSVH